MPRIFTLGDLVTSCKRRVDREYDENIGTSEWKGYISTVYADLFATVASTGFRYFETTETYTTDGSDSYDEPADHFSTVGLDRVYTNGQRRALREIMAQERNLFSGRTGEAVAFTLVDDQIYFLPTPPATQVYELLYIPQPTDLTSSADNTDVDVVTPEGESFLLWGVAVMALFKQGSDIRDAERQRDQSRERVRDWAAMRAITQPRRNSSEYDIETYPWGPFYPGDWGYNR